MALFSKKTKSVPASPEAKKTKPAKEAVAKVPAMAITKAEVRVGIPGIGVTFTLKPRVTEKSAMLSERNVYVFDVPKEATKGAISKAVSTIWKVHPVKIAIIRNAGKKKIARGKKGRTKDVKKAYVYLKKGEKIEIV